MVIEHDPECIRFQHAQIGNYADEHVLEAFLVKSQGKVMMIDDVVTLSRTHDNRNHVAAEKLADLLGDMGSQVVALLVHLPHPDCHLRRAQVGYRDWLQNGVAHDDHGVLQDQGPRKVRASHEADHPDRLEYAVNRRETG